MSFDDYCLSDSAKLKELKRQYLRAKCKIICLESNLKQIDYADFDELMNELEKAYEEIQVLACTIERQYMIEHPAVLPGE